MGKKSNGDKSTLMDAVLRSYPADKKRQMREAAKLAKRHVNIADVVQQIEDAGQSAGTAWGNFSRALLGRILPKAGRTKTGPVIHPDGPKSNA